MRFVRPLLSSLALTLAVPLPAQTASPVAPAPTPAEAPRRMERLTLADAIQRALAKNFTIRLSGFDAAISAAGVTTALGKFDPVLTGRFTKSEAENPQLLDLSTGLRPAATRSLTDDAQLSVDGLGRRARVLRRRGRRPTQRGHGGAGEPGDQEPHRQAPGDVDHHGSPRKAGAGDAHHRHAGKMARDGAKTSANENKCKSIHTGCLAENRNAIKQRRGLRSI